MNAVNQLVIGNKYNRLTVVAPHGVGPRKRNLYKCVCECGTEAVVTAANIFSGNTKSCGCLQRQLSSSVNTTHGHSKGGKVSATYHSWSAMVKRCNNPNEKRYKDYGGRGITVCEEWLVFENFLADMGEKPADGTIERTNNNLGYSKANCVWATRKQQNNNRRDNVVLSYNGKTQTAAQWAEELGITPMRIYKARYKGKTDEQILSRIYIQLGKLP